MNLIDTPNQGFEPVIGLEIHAELDTQSKMFCGCDADHNAAKEPNINICPICLGFPGAMPVLNHRALEMGLLVGIALNCHINEMNVFSRKNYFYPDLPKGYQISQYDQPVASDGWVDVFRENGVKKERVRIRRAHLEEDTAKLFHENDHTLIDFNRSGVPLLEIVTEPDMHSSESAVDFSKTMRSILRYLNVNSGDMEKGNLRFEANVSLRRLGSNYLNTRTEIKNLNSFRSMSMAIEYEIKRQGALLSSNEKVIQETLGWDEVNGRTYPQRGKEESHDYRYFPEPDIPPIFVDGNLVERIKYQLPELPSQRITRFMQKYGLDYSESQALVNDKSLADYFEETSKSTTCPTKLIYTWLTGEMTGQIKERKLTFEDSPVTPTRFGELLNLFSSGRINDFTTKELLRELFDSTKDLEQIIIDGNLEQISDNRLLADKINKILEENPEQVKEYLEGKTGLFQWFMGQVSRETQGKSDPIVVKDLLHEALENKKE